MTKKAQRTPDPWMLEKDRFNNWQIYGKSRNVLDDLPIADNIMSDADARLLVTAPKLFKAVKELLACPGFNAQAFGGAVPVAKLLKAIAEVEGQ